MALVFALAVPTGSLFGCTGSKSTAAVKTDTTAATVDAMADRTITDDAGRTVTVPEVGKLKKIYFTSPVAQIFCFTLAPELSGGTTMDFSAAELKYLPKGTADLKNLGSLASGGKLNPEAIVAEGIQVIFNISSVALTASDISTADDLQKQTGIPVVCIDGSMDKISNAYRKLGTILGKEKEAEKLASYCENTLDAVQKAVETVPQDKRVSVYYAEGPKGLQTEPEASQHAVAFKLAGAKNAAVGVAVGASKGMSEVSLEQVLAWNPQVIIAWDDVLRGGADELIRTNRDWATISAVKNGLVYTMPNVPFSWCDRPPAVNRFLGVQWLANTLYPNAYKVDMVSVTKEFYSLFYHVDLTDSQAKELLGNSYTK
ncbi:MAG: ABC transporter substrate-binding protein [Coriobacteriia bacterium]|nr:ABC transporter substrate-binding protein [Coriobacteriia bacterium]